MIATALEILRLELEQHIALSEADATEEVSLANISQLENGAANSDLTERVVLSLVNIEEEKRLKNNQTVKIRGNEAETINPTINLNLYLLFSANYSNYFKALRRLSQVITYFQGKFVFTQANSPAAFLASSASEDATSEMAGGKLADMRIVLDIHTLNFEQINDLWGSLGGKQVPFVIYRTRLLSLRRQTTQRTTVLIDEINEASSAQ